MRWEMNDEWCDIFMVCDKMRYDNIVWSMIKIYCMMNHAMNDQDLVYDEIFMNNETMRQWYNDTMIQWYNDTMIQGMEWDNETQIPRLILWSWSTQK